MKQSVAFRAMLPRAGLPDVYSFSRVGLWLSDRVHVVHYPVGSGDLLNVVIVTDQLERHLTAEDDPWRIAITQSDVRDALFGSVPVLQDLAMLAADWGGWVLHDDTAPLRMSSGICALVGDAAHPILPYQAQGAAMALEDAEALALCVGDPEQLIETGLKSYQELRHSRTKRVASVSRRNKSIYNLSGPMALARNAVLKLAPGAAIMQQFSWLYGYDVMNEIE